jgi:hypothetical protein
MRGDVGVVEVKVWGKLHSIKLRYYLKIGITAGIKI